MVAVVICAGVIFWVALFEIAPFVGALALSGVIATIATLAVASLEKGP